MESGLVGGGMHSALVFMGEALGSLSKQSCQALTCTRLGAVSGQHRWWAWARVIGVREARRKVVAKRRSRQE